MINNDRKVDSHSNLIQNALINAQIAILVTIMFLHK